LPAVRSLLNTVYYTRRLKLALPSAHGQYNKHYVSNTETRDICITNEKFRFTHIIFISFIESELWSIITGGVFEVPVR
jgi:hypothetical protein